VSTPLGRPRNPLVEQAVKGAVLELLIEGGYDAVSFQRVAARAGVGQPTVYRRWATKAELVEAAVFSVADWSPPARTGRLADDLTALATALMEGLLQPAVRAALPGLVLANMQTPGRHAGLREWAEAPVRAAFAEIVAGAIPRSRRAARARLESSLEGLFDVFLAGLVFPVLTRDPDEARGCVPTVVSVLEGAVAGRVLS